MRKKFRFIICLILSLVAFCSTMTINNTILRADTIYDLSTYFQDPNLYEYLTHLTGKEYLEENSLSSLTTLDIGYANTSTYFTTADVKFTSLVGLQKLNLSNLKTLIVSGHNLTSISSESELIGMTNLEELDVSNNKLTSAILKNFTTLKKANLSNNEITDLNDIVLGDSQTASLYLSCNYIDLTTDEYNNLQSSSVNYQIGLQGVNSNDKFYGKDVTISFFPYKNDNGENACTKIEVYKNEDTTNLISLPYMDGGAFKYSTTLTYAKYTIKFLLNDTVIIVPTGNVEFTLFVPKVLTEFYRNNQKVDPILITKEPITLKFIADGEVFVKVNDSGEYEKLSEFTIDKNGIYNIFYYQVLDGHVGDIQELNISYKIVNPFDFVIIILGIIFFVGVIYIALMYANRPATGNIRKKEKY